jgi:release factor glutamine methyltransferase
MTIFDLQKTSPLPSGETEILMAFLLKKEKEFILTHPELAVPKNIYQKYKKLEKERLAGWPIATLIGHKEFYGLNFFINKDVLVPRPETEIMVEEIINIIKNKQNKLILIDLGTGSGAIIISVAHESKKMFPGKYQKNIFRALDISLPALRIAKKNAILNKQAKKIKFLSGNLLEPLINKKDFNDFSNHELIIAANLPYLTPSQVKNSPSIKKEPKIALVAGPDGLKYYRELFKQLKEIKKVFRQDKSFSNRFKKPITLLCEIDPSQTKSIKILTQKYFPSAKLTIKKDLAQKNRLAIIKILD